MGASVAGLSPVRGGGGKVSVEGLCVEVRLYFEFIEQQS